MSFSCCCLIGVIFDACRTYAALTIHPFDLSTSSVLTDLSAPSAIYMHRSRRLSRPRRSPHSYRMAWPCFKHFLFGSRFCSVRAVCAVETVDHSSRRACLVLNTVHVFLAMRFSLVFCAIHVCSPVIIVQGIFVNRKDSAILNSYATCTESIIYNVGGSCAGALSSNWRGPQLFYHLH